MTKKKRRAQKKSTHW